MRRPAILLVLVLALIGTVAIAGCGGSEEVAPTAEEVEGTVPADTGEATGTEAEGETETEAEGNGGGEGDPAAGKQVFASAGCGGCHVLADANASGNIGPNLDESQPDAELVVERVTNGQGAMPSFKDQLSADDINNVAAYVAQAAGG